MVQIAERISRLGTETAFAVSGEANAFAARGNRIYPFHLGDLNLATPSTVVDGTSVAATSTESLVTSPVTSPPDSLVPSQFGSLTTSQATSAPSSSDCSTAFCLSSAVTRLAPAKIARAVPMS